MICQTCRSDMWRRLKAFARRNVQVGDVDEGNACFEGLRYALGEDVGGDARVGEVAVEETGGAGYLVKRETATLAGQLIDCLEHLEAQGDQLLQPPADLIHGEAHCLIQAGDLGYLDEAPGALAEASDGVFVEVAPRRDPRERHLSLRTLVGRQGPELPLAPEGTSSYLLVVHEGPRGMAARVVGDLARHPSRLRRVDLAP